MHRIGIVGVSYRHVPASQVAQYAIPKADLGARLQQLRAALGGAEVMCLSTCNRVEIVYAEPAAQAMDRRPEVFRALTGREPHTGEAAAALRAWTGEAAVEHLLLVACGLDSAQTGEQEIFAQLRSAWQAAREAGVSGPVLDRIVAEATSMARHAHRLAQHDAPSLADLGVERVLQHLGSAGAEAAAQPRPGTDDATAGASGTRARGGGAQGSGAGPGSLAGMVALVGVSPMTRRCGLRLAARGVRLLVVNRSEAPAQELARELGARALTLAAFRTAPEACAAYVCASGAAEPVLDADLLAQLAPARPLCVDFGVPPNVDPKAAAVLGVARVGIDELVQGARADRVQHLMRLAPVRAAIDGRLARIRAELAARAIGPQLSQLRADFEDITAGEVRRLAEELLPPLDEVQREQLAVWGRTLAHRLAHLPLSGLRAAALHAGPEATEAFFREARLRRGAAAGEAE